MATRRLLPLMLVVASGCFAHGNSYYPYGEGYEACTYYGKYGPRESYFYSPGSDIGRPYGPNDHYYYGGGPTFAWGGGPPVYGPMPPGHCPSDK